MIMCSKCGKQGESYGGNICKECKKKYQEEYRMNNLVKARLAVRKCHDKKRFGAPRETIIGDKCELCGSINRLSVHHKDGNGRRSITPNNSPGNLQTLCNDCHVALHVKKWAKKYNPEWQKKVKNLSGLSHRAAGRELGIAHDTVKSIREQIRKEF